MKAKFVFESIFVPKSQKEIYNQILKLPIEEILHFIKYHNIIIPEENLEEFEKNVFEYILKFPIEERLKFIKKYNVTIPKEEIEQYKKYAHTYVLNVPIENRLREARIYNVELSVEELKEIKTKLYDELDKKKSMSPGRKAALRGVALYNGPIKAFPWPLYHVICPKCNEELAIPSAVSWYDIDFDFICPACKTFIKLIKKDFNKHELIISEYEYKLNMDHKNSS